MPNDSPYHVVLADDDEQYRPHLRRLLAGGPSFEVDGEAGDGSELLVLLEGLASVPQMAILDISMPKMGGIETTSRIKAKYPLMKVLIVSIHREPEYVGEARRAGADGYMLKENIGNELFPAIELIRRGGTSFSPMPAGGDLL